MHERPRGCVSHPAVLLLEVLPGEERADALEPPRAARGRERARLRDQLEGVGMDGAIRTPVHAPAALPVRPHAQAQPGELAVRKLRARLLRLVLQWAHPPELVPRGRLRGRHGVRPMG